MAFNCIIMGAAGRDFHDFLTFFRQRDDFRVCCFTAHQIPYIDQRSFPQELAGDRYDADIPIFAEERLEELIARYQVDFVFLAYSDLAHEQVMHKASRVQAAGASFALLGPKHTQLVADIPVVSVTAVRTGAGKSPLSQAIASHLRQHGKRVGIVRHPMPYGDLQAQAVQRFDTPADLERHACTVEECEEYEPYLELGLPIYAGVDYRAIFDAAAADQDVLLWDGGNNDVSFVRPDLSIVVCDALRPGHELAFYPGETNLRSADVVVIAKVDEASDEQLAEVRRNVAHAAPDASLVEAGLGIEVDDAAIAGKRALVVEDGPTTTHGGRPSGAGLLAAQRAGAGEIIDPRAHAVGSLAQAYVDYPHIDRVLPALGYSSEQRRELRQSIEAAAPDVVVDASPARLGRVLPDLKVPVVTVRYAFEQRSGPDLLARVVALLDG
jgi:predicted GTPase